jgi:hypothetical protein
MNLTKASNDFLLDHNSFVLDWDELDDYSSGKLTTVCGSPRL